MHDVVTRLTGGAIAVTSTRRLAHNILEQYAQGRSRRGAHAWPAPRAMTWGQWLEAEWRRFAGFDPEAGKRMLLDDQQETQVWEQVINRARERDGDYALLQIPATARAARDTWHLLHDWCIPVHLFRDFLSEDTQAFYDWMMEFRELIDRHRWLCCCELPTLLENQLSNGTWRPRRNLMLVGFDEMLPAQNKLLQALQASGVAIERMQAPSVNRHKSVISCEQRREEFEAAAYWSRRLLNDGVSGTIGVVVDDLSRQREQVEIIFDRILHQHESLSRTDERSKAFHISLGKPLAEYPVISTALVLLGFLGGSRPWPDATHVLHSPYLAGGVSESSSRALIDLDLRQQGWEDVSLQGMKQRAEASGLPVNALIRGLDEALNHVVARTQAPSGWAAALIDWLSIFGWPGERSLNSIEFQAVQAWRELISEFARLNEITGEMDVATATGRVGRMALQRVFQGRGEPAPVQIMGVAEAAGMKFSHLWITGMGDDAWPPPTHPDPFIPYPVQRRFGLPGASPEKDLAGYANTTSRLIDSAEQVVVSYPRLNGDRAVGLSALFQGPGELAWERDQAGPASLLGRGAPPPESFTDDCGPALQNSASGGGATLFKDQAACPFRAFARHRLAASRVPGVEAGLDAIERGQLVHDCIARLWQELKSSAALAAMPDKDLRAMVEQSIDAAVAKISRRDNSRFRQGVLRMERVRLPGLLMEWLSVERERVPFDVALVEHKIDARFAGLDLSLRIDRIDLLEDGKYAITDYKTGRSAQVGDWMGERPAEPQLPLYLLAFEEEVGGLAYAHLRTGCSTFKGLAGNIAFAAGIDVAQDWPALLEQWRRVLTGLAEQYKAGNARVDPRDDKVCRLCDVMPFCRVTDRVTLC